MNRIKIDNNNLADEPNNRMIMVGRTTYIYILSTWGLVYKNIEEQHIIRYTCSFHFSFKLAMLQQEVRIHLLRRYINFTVFNSSNNLHAWKDACTGYGNKFYLHAARTHNILLNITELLRTIDASS